MLGTIIFWTAVSALAVSAPCLMIGWRGRLTDDHPHCGRCKFDLFGLPGAARCSECGADLSVRRAVIHGLRVRRRGALAMGLVLACLATTGFSAGRTAAVRGFSFQQHKPVSWLLREADGADSKISDAAIMELTRRVRQGLLSAIDSDAVVDRGLELQADLQHPWNPAWGDLIQSAQTNGRLNGDRWARYRQHAFAFSLDVRPIVCRGDFIPAHLRCGSVRVARRSLLGRSPWFSMTFDVDEDRKASWNTGEDLQYVHVGFIGHGVGAEGTFGFERDELIPIDSESALRLPDGAHELRAEIKVNCRLAAGDERMPPIRIEVRQPWKLVSAGGTEVLLRKNPATSDVVRRAIKIDGVTLDWREQIHLHFLAKGLPIAVASSVTLRAADGTEWDVGNVVLRAGDNATWLIDRSVAQFHENRVAVILKPSAEAAKLTVTLGEIWGDEIVIPDVPVKLHPRLQD